MFKQFFFLKFSRIFAVITLMAVALSCSKDDDDPEPNVEDAALSFAQGDAVIEVPQNLLQSEDPHANMAAAWVAMANGLSTNIALFAAQPGATKQTQLITPINGRTSAGSGVVYIWNADTYDVAYQVRESDSKYIFELFYKGDGDAGWYRYLYAEELKDRSKGFMAVYDAWGDSGVNRGDELLRWEWTRKGDMFTFEMSDVAGEFNIVVTVNTKSQEGSVKYFENDAKISEITWDAQGHGSWKDFDDTGAVEDEGTF